jgi:hypothetical protein
MTLAAGEFILMHVLPRAASNAFAIAAYSQATALPKSLKSGNFTLAKAGIRWMSVNFLECKTCFSLEDDRANYFC